MFSLLISSGKVIKSVTIAYTKNTKRKRIERFFEEDGEMVRVSKAIMQKAATLISDFLVCPLSKQPLRYCEESSSLISDTIAVSFPIKNGIPCLVPRDGKILDEEDASKPDNNDAVNEENKGRNS